MLSMGSLTKRKLRARQKRERKKSGIPNGNANPVSTGT